MQQIIIREAKEEDANQIATFQLEMALETENIQLKIETVTQGVQHVFQKPERGVYYVAEINNELVASLLTTYEWSDWRNGTVLWIQSVYVSPTFRKIGIYKKMYQYIQKKVIKLPELKGIRLYADRNNTSAQQVYQKLGMNSEHYQLFEWLKE